MANKNTNLSLYELSFEVLYRVEEIIHIGSMAPMSAMSDPLKEFLSDLEWHLEIPAIASELPFLRKLHDDKELGDFLWDAFVDYAVTHNKLGFIVQVSTPHIHPDFAKDGTLLSESYSWGCSTITYFYVDHFKDLKPKIKKWVEETNRAIIAKKRAEFLHSLN